MADTSNTASTPGAEPALTTPFPVTPAGGTLGASSTDLGASSGTTSGTSAGGSETGSQARTRFSAAIDEARAGVQALRGEALDRTNAYRTRAVEGATDWVEECKTVGSQAKERATQLAGDGKARASEGLAALSKTVSENAATIDEKFGTKYGDYARQAARTMQDAAAKLDSKDINELGDDARTFVRSNPAAAVGIAAFAGYIVARVFRSADD